MGRLNVWMLTHPAESMIQHPTPHHLTSKLEASPGAVAEIALNEISDEAFGPDMSRKMQEKLMHNEGDFFQKYKKLVPKHEWEAFCSLISRERDYQATLFSKIFDGYLRGYWMGTGEQLDQHSDDILLIEDLDISCILALDVQFDLDPQFILSYAGLKGPMEFGHTTVPHRKSGLGTKGSWYTISGSIDSYDSVQIDESSPTVRRMIPGFWKRGQTSNTKRPWCQEARRQKRTHGITSVIACYCLTDSLRE